MNTPPQLVFAPRARPGLNYSEAFGFLFRRPGGWPVILIGGVLLMFSWLIVPFLVVMGYGVALGRAVAAGDPELPRFEIGMAGDGLKAVVILFLYSLPLVAVYILAFIPFFFLSAEGTEPPAAFMFMMFALMFVVMIYGLALAAIQPALFAIFIADGTIGSCFRFRRIKELMKTWGGDYAGAAAIVFGMGYLFQFGFILLFIGIFFTGFYFLAFASHVAGQLARPLIVGAAPVAPGPASVEPTGSGSRAPEPTASLPIVPPPVPVEPTGSEPMVRPPASAEPTASEPPPPRPAGPHSPA